jgi:hypothetical protein
MDDFEVDELNFSDDYVVDTYINETFHYDPSLDYVPRTRPALKIKDCDRTPVIDYTAQYLAELAARSSSDSF